MDLSTNEEKRKLNPEITKQLGLEKKSIEDWNIQDIADYKHEAWLDKARKLETEINEIQAKIKS